MAGSLGCSLLGAGYGNAPGPTAGPRTGPGAGATPAVGAKPPQATPGAPNSDSGRWAAEGEGARLSRTALVSVGKEATR